MGIKEVWNNSSVKKRRQLASALGYKSEWGKVRYENLESRDGGMLKRDLRKLWTMRKTR